VSVQQDILISSFFQAHCVVIIGADHAAYPYVRGLYDTGLPVKGLMAEFGYEYTGYAQVTEATDLQRPAPLTHMTHFVITAYTGGR